MSEYKFEKVSDLDNYLKKKRKEQKGRAPEISQSSLVHAGMQLEDEVIEISRKLTSKGTALVIDCMMKIFPEIFTSSTKWEFEWDFTTGDVKILFVNGSSCKELDTLLRDKKIGGTLPYLSGLSLFALIDTMATQILCILADNVESYP